jgi:hypothetical protein
MRSSTGDRRMELPSEHAPPPVVDAAKQEFSLGHVLSAARDADEPRFVPTPSESHEDTATDAVPSTTAGETGDAPTSSSDAWAVGAGTHLPPLVVRMPAPILARAAMFCVGAVVGSGIFVGVMYAIDQHEKILRALGIAL